MNQIKKELELDTNAIGLESPLSGGEAWELWYQEYIDHYIRDYIGSCSITQNLDGKRYEQWWGMHKKRYLPSTLDKYTYLIRAV